jgi:3-phosphoshikimate 1-carboxyvinyltransferase
VSSQFVSGLLFALPLAEGESVIKLIPPIESRSYINMTIDAMRRFGVLAEWDGDDCLRVAGNQTYQPQDETVEGDYSNAAFLDALNRIGGEVVLTGLREESLQGDRCYREAMDALCRSENATVSLADCPDLGPILFAAAAGLCGAEFIGTRRLKIKESDRAEAMAEELRKFGCNVTVFENSVKIEKSALHTPNEILSGHNDHRIVMSLAVLASIFGGEIEGTEAVKKSYPNFFEDIAKLGISFTHCE